MSEIDQQFVEYIIKSLVNHPDKVEIARSVDERGVLLELSVDPEDLGRVIGKRGATAQSLRTLLRALGTKNEARYNLKIVDTGYPEGKGPRAEESQPAAQPTSDDGATDDSASPAPVVADEDAITTEESVAEAEPTIEAEAPAQEVEDDDQVDLASKTRRELAELDDLEL